MLALLYALWRRLAALPAQPAELARSGRSDDPEPDSGRSDDLRATAPPLMQPMTRGAAFPTRDVRDIVAEDVRLADLEAGLA
jgi:hypothetical protein